MSGVTSLINNQSRKPTVTVPTVTLTHNAAIPASDGFLCGIVNFENDSVGIGTFGGTSLENGPWQWSSGFFILHKSGVGEDDILLKDQVVAALPAVKVMPMGDGTAVLVADLTTAGGTHKYFVTDDGDKFPIYDYPAAAIAGLPQLRAAAAGSPNFTANFGSNFAVPNLIGTTVRFVIHSQAGKLIYVIQGAANRPLHINASNQLAQDSGADIICSSASLSEALNGSGQAKFQLYGNEDNDTDEYVEHDYAVIPFDITFKCPIRNFSFKSKYNANAAADGVALRWSDANSRVEGNFPGATNLTFKGSDTRPEQEIINL